MTVKEKRDIIRLEELDKRMKNEFMFLTLNRVKFPNQTDTER